jgi:hypothetical protein
MTFEASEPERPAGIPSGATWNGALGKWELCARAADGARVGEAVLYRPDGRVYAQVQVRGGREEGPFVTSTPTGASPARATTAAAASTGG